MKKRKRIVRNNPQNNTTTNNPNNSELNQDEKNTSSTPEENSNNSDSKANNSINSSNNAQNNSSQSNSSLKSKLCCFSSTDYIVLASTLAIALGEELSQTDLNILSTFFAVLSDELALITAVQGCSTGDESVFVPPVPDVALTSSKQKNSVHKPKKHSKKIVKKRLKKK